MTWHLIAIGKIRDDTGLVAEYTKRLGARCRLVEIDTKSLAKLTPAERLKREHTLIEAAIPKNAIIIALDAGGTIASSEEFAGLLDNAAPAPVAIIIGGADGLDAAFKKQANHRIAFGRMIWPHALARIMALEQLYRAHCILTNHPYHRPAE